MSTTHLSPATSTFFLLSIMLLCFPGTTRSDNPCPYPCYPPPTGSGTPTTPTTPAVSTAPPAPTQSGTGSIYPPPAGYNPYNPTPPYGGGGSSGGSGGGDGSDGGVYGAPPPPDPILPYFPFYYKKPPHKTQDTSSASITMQKWTGMIATTSLLSLLLFV